MCEHCEIIESELVRYKAAIEDRGYAGIAIEATPHHPSWIYTIGLTESFDHPELSMVGAPLEPAIELMGELADLVVARFRIPKDQDIGVDGVLFHVIGADQQVLDGDMFLEWREYYRWRGRDVPQLSAVEIFPCRNQRRNRAQRRAEARRRHLGVVR